VPELSGPKAAEDFALPFAVGATRLRGRLIRVGPALDRILGQHDYPDAVATMLGEAIVLAAALAGALKYDGVFTLQTKSDGPIRLLVADVTAQGDVRGYAQFDADKLARATAGAPVPRLLGSGFLAFTVDQGEHTERYQGLVELQGATLAECAHHYFRQSQQLEAGLKVAVARGTDGRWRGGGLMIERLPSEDALHADDVEEDWRRAVILMSSCTDVELTDAALEPDRLLYRLFHEPGVRVQPARGLAAKCRCSRERVEGVLAALPRDALDEMIVDGRISVKCEFCSARYEFDEEDRRALTP
jgi:molecular chaperone Hsp33